MKRVFRIAISKFSMSTQSFLFILFSYRSICIINDGISKRRTRKVASLQSTRTALHQTHVRDLLFLCLLLLSKRILCFRLSLRTLRFCVLKPLPLKTYGCALFAFFDNVNIIVDSFYILLNEIIKIPSSINTFPSKWGGGQQMCRRSEKMLVLI